MKVNKYRIPELKENHVDVYYNQEDAEVTALFEFFGHNTYLIGIKDQIRRRLELKDIYYFESVDKACFAYLERDVYQVEGSLAFLEECLKERRFIRVNKSTILNIYKIDYLKAEINMRVNAYLENGECVTINRSYKKAFDERLKELSRTKGMEEENGLGE